MGEEGTACLLFLREESLRAGGRVVMAAVARPWQIGGLRMPVSHWLRAEGTAGGSAGCGLAGQRGRGVRCLGRRDEEGSG